MENPRFHEPIWSFFFFKWILKRKQVSPLLFHFRNVRYSLLVYLPCFFRHVVAKLAHYFSPMLLLAASHLCPAPWFRDLGGQEYYTATWKEQNTWLQLSAELNSNTGLFSASLHKSPFFSHTWGTQVIRWCVDLLFVWNGHHFIHLNLIQWNLFENNCTSQINIFGDIPSVPFFIYSISLPVSLTNELFSKQIPTMVQQSTL